MKRFPKTGQGRSDVFYQHAKDPASRGGKAIATLRWIANGQMMQLECGYNAALVDTLKKSISPKKRIYDAADKSWYFVSDQFDILKTILEQYFDDTILLDFPAPEAAEDAWQKLWLLEDAPLEVVRAAYKALALLHHPDRGGDPARMTEINTAYKEILGVLAEQNGKED